jgi:hypothetical protein
MLGALSAEGHPPQGESEEVSVSRELASKAYYKVKTVVWTPF